jgi:hypothetical protein
VKDLAAVKDIFFVLLILAGALLVLGLLTGADRAAWAIPSPETTAEGFVSALGAHRYTGALGALSQELREHVSGDDLRSLVQAIESSPRSGIQDAHEQGSQESGENASAQVQVKYGDNSQENIEFPLVNENGVWKINSIDPLAGMTGSE